MEDPRPSAGCRASLWRVVRATYLAGHVAGAVGWVLLLPGGFPAGHARFWANRALPAAVAVVAVAALALLWRRRELWSDRAALAFVAFWTALASSWLWTFPSSRHRAGALFAAVVVPQIAVALGAIVRARALRWGHAAAVVAGGLVGAAVPATQFAPPAATRPIDERVQDVRGLDVAKTCELTPNVRVDADRGVVRVTGAVTVQVAPLLTFRSRSPDRGWTLFARRRDRAGPARRRTGMSAADGSVSLGWEQDGPMRLDVARGDVPGAATLTAWTHLPEPVYSHLNDWCRIDVSRIAAPQLVFSPCPDTPLAVGGASDVLGRRARRFAYLDADSQFRVVEAASLEKGPFRTVAAGPLGAGEPLEISLLDGARRVARIVFQDWARQADTTNLSPTAGWGVPANAIEFVAGEIGGVSLHLSLAGTSIGRGWYSVGHAAGTYRNRMRIEVEPR
jgi:hypothetical protein